MLKKQLKRSAKYNEDGALPELIGKDLEKNYDNIDTKMEDDEEAVELQDDEVVDDENDGEELPPEDDAEEVPDHLETDLEEPEEEFKDINEKVVVYLYRGFSEIGDQVRLFVEDEDNEERDPELVETLQDFMEGFPEVMAVVKDLAEKYVTSVELFDPEEGEEVNPEDDEELPPEDDTEEPVDDLEDDVEDAEVVESYVKEHNLDHNRFESEYEIYAGYKTSEEADKFEEDFRKFKNAEVFRHEDIGEVHAFIRVK